MKRRRTAAKSPVVNVPKLYWPVRSEHIGLVCQTIAEKFRPDKIILFGSQAYGQPHDESDIDLLVIMPFEGSPFYQAGIIVGHLMDKVGVFPLDLLVRTKEQVQQRLDIEDRFMQEIIERGRVMYKAIPPVGADLRVCPFVTQTP